MPSGIQEQILTVEIHCEIDPDDGKTLLAHSAQEITPDGKHWPLTRDKAMAFISLLYEYCRDEARHELNGITRERLPPSKPPH